MVKALLIFTLLSLCGAVTSVQSQDTPTMDWSSVQAVFEASDIDDAILIIGNEEGELVRLEKGALQGDDVRRIASASKWLTSATVMTLVEDGTLGLDDNPQDYLPWWTNDPDDPRSQVTIAHLLSFTSGFVDNRCTFAEAVDPLACARAIYDRSHVYEPGTAFIYGSSHMHILGAIVTTATDQDFNTVFRDRIADPLGLSDATLYQRPSITNPLLAGGADSTPDDYNLFLRALLAGDILAESRDVMFSDYTQEPVELAETPLDDWGYEWHYTFGAWRECNSPVWLESCDDQQIVSSTGALGWMPWIDFDNGYYGLLAYEGRLGSAEQSINLVVEMRPHILTVLTPSS